MATSTKTDLMPKLPKSVGHSKVVSSIGIGILCAWLNVKGSNGFVIYAGLCNMIAVGVANLMGIQEEDIGGKFPIMMEAFMPSLATFILVWTAVSNYLSENYATL